MNGDRFRLSITGVTGVPSGVRRLRFLHKKEARGAVTFLRDHGDTASGRVVTDYLEHREREKDYVRDHSVDGTISLGSYARNRGKNGGQVRNRLTIVG